MADPTDDTDVLEHENHEGPTAEEALAATRAQLAASEDARRQAEARALTAGGQAANAQELALSAALSSEEANLAAARAAYRTAREAGDVDKEADAQEALALSRVRVEQLKNDKARMAQQRANPPQRQTQQNDNVPGPAARAWISAHPEMDTNPAYRAEAIDAHNKALRAGFQVESPEYFQVIDSQLAGRFGANHGKGGQQVTDPKPTPRQPGPRASSFATPPGRGNPTNARGTHNINDIASKLNVTPDTIREFAEISGMQGKTEAERLENYLKSQAAILAERDSSITYGDGAVYR